MFFHSFLHREEVTKKIWLWKDFFARNETKQYANKERKKRKIKRKREKKRREKREEKIIKIFELFKLQGQYIKSMYNFYQYNQKFHEKECFIEPMTSPLYHY